MTASTETAAPDLTIDVSAALPFGSEHNAVAADVHLPEGPPRAVLLCWPGGSYSRSYWDLHVPGRAGYSFAEHMTSDGFLVIAADPLGVGASSRPKDVDAVTLEAIAAAGAEFVREVRHRLGAGDLHPELEPLPAGVPLVGVGHSLGGAICVVTQAIHDCYDGVADLGYTHGSKDALEGGPAASTSDLRAPRRAAEAQAKAFFGSAWDDGYALAAREPHHGWLYAADVPQDVIAVDDRGATAWPRQSYVEALHAGFTAPFAARITCPLLLAFGDQDIPGSPRDDAGFYTASPDITVLTLVDSAHSHNLATTRTMLWDRIGTWAAAVGDALPASAAVTA
jgi:pimeloyl-ACP methyl ester carboxylesterase